MKMISWFHQINKFLNQLDHVLTLFSLKCSISLFISSIFIIFFFVHVHSWFLFCKCRNKISIIPNIAVILNSVRLPAFIIVIFGSEKLQSDFTLITQ